MISRDIKALDESSAVFGRLKEYSNLFDELHVVVMGRNSNLKSLHTEKLYIYNRTSGFKTISFVSTFFKSFSLAQKSKSVDTWITSQDPFESGLLAFMIAKLTKCKLQLQFHTDCFNSLYFKHSVSNYFRTLIARFIVTRADSIRVVSERIKSSLLTIDNKLSTRISVLPVWTDIEEISNIPIKAENNLREKFPEFKKIILIVARLESEKNIDLSLLAFKKLLRFKPDTGLVIAGNGGKSEWLTQYARILGIEDSVRFLGWQSDVVSLYKSVDLLLVTSLYEGYGLNIVESIACGTPVVSTDVGVAKDVGAYIVNYDAGEIALRVSDVVEKDSRVSLNKEYYLSKKDFLDKFKRTFN